MIATATTITKTINHGCNYVESAVYGNQASKYAIQHIWCLSLARINWEGCIRKGIRRKIGGMMEVGASMVLMGWRPAGLSAHLLLLSFPCLIKSRITRFRCEMVNVFWYRHTRVVPDKEP